MDLGVRINKSPENSCKTRCKVLLDLFNDIISVEDAKLAENLLLFFNRCKNDVAMCDDVCEVDAVDGVVVKPGVLIIALVDVKDLY